MAATPIAVFIKDPDAILDYALNWTKWLEGDTIQTGTWTIDAGPTIQSQNVSGGIVTMWLSGGVDGTSYIARCRIVTVGGRTEDRTIQIQVRER
jgi:hypothetical protein